WRACSPSQLEVTSGASSTATPSAARPAPITAAARRGSIPPSATRSGGGVGQHAHRASAPPGRELHRARGARVERVVLADAHARARLELRPALAHDDLAAG